MGQEMLPGTGVLWGEQSIALKGQLVEEDTANLNTLTDRLLSSS